MFYKSKFKDYVGILFYRHGLFCASNPVSCLVLVFSVVFICCCPLRNLSSFSSSLEQFKQSISVFDGLEANSEINQFIEYDRLADRPAWYNRVPISYIQRIVVKSVLNIPNSSDNKNFKNKTNDQLYLVDAFRTPLVKLFEINEFLRNFRTEKQNSTEQQSLIDDLCVHVGEIRKITDESPSSEQKNAQQFRTFLPEFNCLYLSPSNFWSNDFNLFIQDDDIIQTINNSPNYFKDLGLKQNKQQSQSKSKLINQVYSLLHRIIFSTNQILDEESSTDLSELLFGVSWNSVVTLLKDDEKLLKKVKNVQLNNKSIVFTYAITIALKKFDKTFIDELKQKLQMKFDINVNDNIAEDDKDYNTIFNLQYTSQSIVYYIPYLVLYFLLFLYIYISVRKIEFVKSKWGLAFAAVSQVVASLLMSIGICSYFGLTPTLNGGEIFPYLIIFIGFENIVVLTKSVVSTPFDLDVRYRIALGLKKESWLITKILIFELIIIFFGILTMVPSIQEFCVFAYVGLIIDFFMQMIFFVTVLSIDIRRMELTDLENHHRNENSNISATHQNDNKTNDMSQCQRLLKRNGKSDHDNQSSKYSKTDKRNSLSKKYSNLLINKSVQFFYFWAKTRLVQRCVMVLSVVWIILIFYKSLLVVELMRHDVNVSKETVEALLPKGSGLPKLIQHNFQQYIFTSPKSLSKPENENPAYATAGYNFLSSIDYMKRNFKSFISVNSEEQSNENNSLYNTYNNLKSSSISHNWKSLDYFHWLSLFAKYNVSLYNRYVAILPDININRIIQKEDIFKSRNQNEIKKYNSILLAKLDDNQYEQQQFNSKANITVEDEVSVRWALYELIGIVILGIPTIYFIVYLFTLIYKFLCTKNYEQWRKTWSTANIKRQYKRIHLRTNFKNCLICDNTGGLFKTDCQTCNSVKNSDSNESYSSYDSDYESEKIGRNRKLSYSETSDLEIENIKLNRYTKFLNQDDILNKIINGQKDDIELKPIKIFNSETYGNNLPNFAKKRHKFPIDIISVGSSKLVTSDINNQIKIWTINTNTDVELNDIDDFNISNSSGQIAIWSLCLTKDDQYLLVGLSNGQLTLFDLEDLPRNKSIYQSINSDNNGITHLIEFNRPLAKYLNKKNHILLRNSSKQHTNMSNYLILISRLNGLLEIINCIPSNDQNDYQFDLIHSIRISNSPITNLVYEGNYLIATSQEFLFKIVKFNFDYVSFTSNQNVKNQFFNLNDKEENKFTEIIRVSDDQEEEESLITAICIDKENSLSAATGSQNGLICLWNLQTGRCDLKLRCNTIHLKNLLTKSKNMSSTKRDSILKIELSQNLIISLNEDHQLFIWSRSRGELIKEFKLLSPIKNRVNKHGIDSGELNSNMENYNNSLFNSLHHSFKSFFKKYSSQENLDENLFFKPVPNMCLYSRKILITGGCSCILLWNIAKGELVKKISIKKPLFVFRNKLASSLNSKYSENNFIKEIRLIKRNLFEEFNSENCSLTFKTSNNTNNSLKQLKKLVLITDYSDTFYVLKIPTNLDLED